MKVRQNGNYILINELMPMSDAPIDCNEVFLAKVKGHSVLRAMKRCLWSIGCEDEYFRDIEDGIDYRIDQTEGFVKMPFFSKE